MEDHSFHVFLPPTLLPLSSFKADSPIISGLIFYDLPTSGVQLPSQSQPAQETKRIPPPQPTLEKTQQNERTADPAPSAEVADEVESWDESVVVGKVPAKRSRDSLDEDDSVADLPDKAAYTQSRVNASRALAPRRSARVSRTSDALLSVQQLDGTESFMSLNTTVTNSQPSQPPLPNWSLPLAKLVSLQSLLAGRAQQRQYEQKISLMVCVMAVETLQQLRRKEEKAHGQEGTLWLGEWKVTAPPEGDRNQLGGADAIGCSVKLWDRMAKEWGDGRVRRGDVVLLENVEYKPATARDPATITVSSNSAAPPKVTILYRTLVRRAPGRSDYLPPRAPNNKARGFGQMLAPPAGLSARILAEDEALRPDLRLSRSDAGVRRVLEWAIWFANWVAGDPP